MLTHKISISLAIEADLLINYKIIFSVVCCLRTWHNIHSCLSRFAVLVLQMQCPGILILYIGIYNYYIFEFIIFQYFLPRACKMNAQGMPQFMAECPYKISSLFVGRQCRIRVNPPSFDSTCTFRPHISPYRYSTKGILSLRKITRYGIFIQ